MRKLLKVFVSVLLVSVCALAFVACGEEQVKPAGKTHDQNTLQVTGKDFYEPHNFIDGKCTMCDETTVFTQDPVGGTDVMKECAQKGTVEKITYTTKTYHKETVEDLEKTAYVYLPYGYDPADTTVKYDVLYMLHGKGLNEGYWFAQGTYAPTDSIYTKGFGTQNMLDNLMKDGKANKTICVTPTFYEPGTGGGDEDPAVCDLAKELVNDLMPYIAGHYNTYASGDSDEALKANRDHQGYVGLSMGALYSMSAIWAECLEYFSYIGTFSGGAWGAAAWDPIIEAKNTVYKDCDINYWYVGLGTVENDKVYPGDPFGTYRAVKSGVGLQSGSDLNAGDNCEFVYCNKTGHNYATWITCLYNCMQVFFRAK